MTQIATREIKEVPLVDIEKVLNLVSTALDLLSSTWQALQGPNTADRRPAMLVLIVARYTVVKAAVDFVKTLVVTSAENRRRIAGLRLKQAEMLCELFE